MNRLDGKIAVTTGGTQGLGAAISRRFAAAGASGLVICGRSADRGEAVSRQISRDHEGVRAVFVRADLVSVDDCRNVIATADREFGRIDILVNAAATTDRGTLVDTSEALFDRMFATNVRAPFFLMQEAVKLMIRDGVEGSIVNIGSISSMAGQPFISAYCASKGALATLTKNSGYALMRNRIRVNQLDIGWMASDGEDRIQRTYHDAEDGWQARAGQERPFGRLIDPEEVARAVNFIASDDCGLMTGSVIPFDQSVPGACSFAPPAPLEPMQTSENDRA